LRILAFDIETFPNEVWTWGLWNQNIAVNQIQNPGTVACWAAQWFDTGEVFYDSINRNDPVSMHRNLHELLCKADVVVSYNGKKFDIPWVQTGFVTYGMRPPTFAHIDLLHVVRRQFKFPSYKLEYVVKALGVGEKTPNAGFDLWKRCMAGDQDAWKLMEEYNINDTLLLDKLYNRVLPFITNHPNRSLVEGLVCPNCGSSHYTKDGIRRNKGGMYQKYACSDCGTPFRGNTNLAPKEKFLPL